MSNPSAFPVADVLARTRIPASPSRLAVAVPEDIRVRLEVLAGTADERTAILADAARDGIKAAFEAYVATLGPEVRGRCEAAARRGDEAAAEEAERKARQLEDRRRMERERERLAAAEAERNRPAPKAPGELIAEAATAWLDATAATSWTGEFVAGHRNAVLGSLEGKAMSWPFSPHPSDGPFLAAVRAALGVHDDATLDGDQMQTIRRIVDEAKAARGRAIHAGPRAAVASGSGYIGRR